MAFQAALTVDQLNAIRSGRYQALQYVCVVPNDVVVQFNPDSAPTTAVYAEITVGSVASGDMADIKQEQTVIFSTTADYQATEVFRTRVRKVSGTSTLYVGENSQSLTTSHYVTVLNTYEIQEKLRKSETYADWDILFRKLLPIETALPSAVVLSNDVTTYTPPANAIVMDASASTIDTHAWESSNANDSFDDDTLAQPEITLEAGAFRWLRYTFTDDNGNSNFRVIPVWTVPKNYDNPYVVTGFIGESGDVASIAHDPELGWNATVPAWAGIQDLINKTFVAVATDEWYNDVRQSIRTNINFVGYTQSESSNTRGDEAAGKLSETSFTLEGFGHQLARQNIATIRVAQVSGTPTAWGHIQNPTPARMLTYHLTEGSTLFHLCSMTIPADDTDFIGGDLNITNGKALDDMRFIVEVINAELQFDVNGKLDLCRNLNFLDDTARDAAPVAGVLTVADFLDLTHDYDYSKTTSQLTMSGGVYDSTADEYDDLYEAIAPAVARLGEGDPLEIANQVLTTDSTETEALAEISQRAANVFAYNNPTDVLRGTPKDEWHFIVIDVGSWWKFDIAEADFARGKTFDENTRWQCVEVNHSTNNETGRKQATHVFRRETSDTGAIIRARQILTNTNADIIYYPAVLAPFTGADLEYTDGRFFDGFDVVSNSEQNPPEPGCENGGFRIGGDWEAAQTAETNETVVSTVQGAGRIYNGSNFDFTVSNQGFSVTTHGSYSGGVGFVQGEWTEASGPGAGNSHRGVAIERTGLALGTVSRVQVVFDYEQGDPDVPTAGEAIIQLNGGTVAQRSFDNINDGNDQVWEWSGFGGVEDVTEILVQINCDFDQISDGARVMSGTVTIKAIIIEEDVYGDSFYWWTGSLETPDGSPSPYSAGNGLQFRDDDVPSIPLYNPDHLYEFTSIINPGGAVYYNFINPYGSGQADNWSIQIEACFLDDV